MIDFLNYYKKELTELINNIDNNVIKEIINSLEELHKNKGKIYVIGNGGSAATASHMVNDLGAGLTRRGIRNFNIESLADNVAVVTALSNDIGYDNIFSMQIKNKITSKDILIAISCSGNSKNIIEAVNYAKTMNTTIIGLTGFDGGELKKKSDISFHVQTKKDNYGLVEDVHMILDHILYSYYIDLENK